MREPSEQPTPHPGQEQKSLAHDVAVGVISGGAVEIGKVAIGKVLGGSGGQPPPAPAPAPQAPEQSE